MSVVTKYACRPEHLEARPLQPVREQFPLCPAYRRGTPRSSCPAGAGPPRPRTGTARTPYTSGTASRSGLRSRVLRYRSSSRHLVCTVNCTLRNRPTTGTSSPVDTARTASAGADGSPSAAEVGPGVTKGVPGLAHGGSEFGVIEIAGFSEVRIDRVVLEDHEHPVEEIAERPPDPFPVRLGSAPGFPPGMREVRCTAGPIGECVQQSPLPRCRTFRINVVGGGPGSVLGRISGCHGQQNGVMLGEAARITAEARAGSVHTLADCRGHEAGASRRVLRIRHAMLPCSSTSSLGVPTRSVTMAKKRESISCWGASAAVIRSVWLTGRMPWWSQVRVTGLGRSGGGGLFAQVGAVPGEDDSLQDCCTVRCHSELRCAAAERSPSGCPGPQAAAMEGRRPARLVRLNSWSPMLPSRRGP
jgi:hypothetical protein